MAKPIMVLGTMSNTGKSVITAGLCRIFRQDGYNPAPFKSQNMALNSFITADGGEMGRAQVMQAEAAGIEPDVRMNPILLKPTGVRGSQVIVKGRPIGVYNAFEYAEMRDSLIPHIMEAYNSLGAEHDILALEGAGSPAEINLKENDISNMGMSALANAPVILAGDIDRGGVFASLAGTMLLFTEAERRRVRGVVINKFRGDADILKPGLEKLEKLINVPVLGVIPHLDLDLDDEDSLSGRLSASKGGGLVDIAVIRLPRLSNFTDFTPFERIRDVDLRYVGSVREFGNPDLVILPGTKNTLADLIWLKETGLSSRIAQHHEKGLPVFGICGGYQMLGRSIRDPHNVEHGGTVAGLGLLDCDTVFEPGKTTKQVSGRFASAEGIFHKLSGLEFSGFEIHMGQTGSGGTPLQYMSGGEPAGQQKNNVYGSYVHGIFDGDNIIRLMVEALMDAKGLDSSAVEAVDLAAYKEKQYDALADALRKSLDIGRIYEILWEGV